MDGAPATRKIKKRAAGLRTFALTGLMGGVTGALAQHFDAAVVIGLCLPGFTAAFTAYHWLEAQAERNYSATSVIAGMSTFLLGALAVVGDLKAATPGLPRPSACAARTAASLGRIAELERDSIGPDASTMTFLMLPIPPNRPVDPWSAINPYEIWLLTILIAAVSFAGYVAVRLWGPSRRADDRRCRWIGVFYSHDPDLGQARPPAPGVQCAAFQRVLLAGLTMIIRVAVVGDCISFSVAASLSEVAPACWWRNLPSALECCCFKAGACRYGSPGHEPA